VVEGEPRRQARPLVDGAKYTVLASPSASPDLHPGGGTVGPVSRWRGPTPGRLNVALPGAVLTRAETFFLRGLVKGY